ncbi:Uncharacterized protein C03F11.2 [Toxocara canis]|uniref:Metallo-beta-lactamase domain-containing protein 1 n=1 Tax=Toxocara canis TaxID=6265 RepID=A0A0B2UPQ9_TOXCA|nr:Uncharacterized protein C03F11.2 [Toxocara canis]
MFPALPKYSILIALLNVYTVQPAETPVEEISDMDKLNDFELKLLKDFVRRRGKGSVSRLPLKDIFDENEENSQSNFLSNDRVSIGGQMFVGNTANIDRLRISKNNSSEHIKFYPMKINESKNEPNFEQLAELLKKLAGRRKNKPQQAIDVNTTGTLNHWNGFNSSTENTTSTHSIITVINSRPLQSTSKMVSIGTLRTSKSESTHGDSSIEDDRNRYLSKSTPSRSKNASSSDDDIAWLSSTNRNEEWENKMRELTRQLSVFLSSIKRQNEADRSLHFGHYEATSKDVLKQWTPAIVHIIRQGSAVQYGDNEYQFIASIVLVQDESTNILIDTGLGTDTNGRTHMHQTLSNLNVKPSDVHYVVSTHGHPSHSGNTNDFPDSFHYAGNYVYHRNRFNFSQLLEDTTESLTSNVYLLKARGHSSDDISVIVRNADTLGTVAISGDIFIRKEDLTYPLMWRPLSTNETQQAESRRRLLCLADYIVPGHGHMFAVTESIKNECGCATDFKDMALIK